MSPAMLLLSAPASVGSRRSKHLAGGDRIAVAHQDLAHDAAFGGLHDLGVGRGHQAAFGDGDDVELGDQ